MEAFEDRARRINAALNASDLNPIGDLYADDAVLVWPGLPALRGRDAIVGLCAELLGALPDLERTISGVVARRGTFAIEWQAKAIHGGSLALPSGDRFRATGREVLYAGVSFGEVDAEGRIRSQREYFDRAAIREQLGGLQHDPGDAAAGDNGSSNYSACRGGS